jgi:hypothetical protein
MEGFMLKSRSLPVILIVLAAAILPTARAGGVEPAADACRATPGASSPPGSHWYYRINHADNRHCWYLGSVALKVHSRAPEATAHSPLSDPTPVSEDAAETSPASPAPMPQAAPPAQVASAPSNPALSNERPPLGFAVRWSDLTKSREIDARAAAAPGTSAGDGNATAFAVAPAPPMRPTERSYPLLDSAAAAIAPILAAVALVMASLAIAGAGLVRRPFHRLASLLRLGRYLGRDRPDDFAESRAKWRSLRLAWDGSRPHPVPTDPARDVKASLRELMDDLRRADAADRLSRFTRRKPRSELQKRLSMLTPAASQATSLLRLGGPNQSIWRAAETSPDTLVSEER